MHGNKQEPSWVFNNELKKSGTYPWKYGVDSVNWTFEDREQFKYWATLNDAALMTDFNNKNEVIRYQDKVNKILDSLHSVNRNHGMQYLDVDGIPGKNTMDFIKKVNSKMDAYRIANPMSEFDKMENEHYEDKRMRDAQIEKGYLKYKKQQEEDNYRGSYFDPRNWY
jgi:hypothetical protein